MATKEELEVQNAALKEELEEARREAAMEQNVWNSSLPSPKENRDRVQKRRGYEQAAVSSLVGAQKDATSVAESSVNADLEKELERLRKENEDLKSSSVAEEETAKDGVAKKGDDQPAKKTAQKKTSFS